MICRVRILRRQKVAASVAVLVITASIVASAATPPKPSAEAKAAKATCLAKEAPGKLVAAYAACDELLTTFAAEITAKERSQIEAREKALEQATGTIAVRVNEPGAEVLLDGKSLGVSPIPPVRVEPGTHTLKVTKAGFPPFEGPKEIAKGAAVTADVVLEAETKTGKLTVKVTPATPLRVVVDGKEVGDAPWSGDVPAGAHTVEGRGSAMSAPAQSAVVPRGGNVEVTLLAATNDATITIHADPAARVSIDGRVAGNGDVSAPVPAGEHDVDVTRDGFAPYHRHVRLAAREAFADAVTLQQEVTAAAPVVHGKDFFGGLYGGFAPFAMFEPAGEGNALDLKCGANSQLGASSCDTSSPFGGGLAGWVGYTWNPIGVELWLAASYDNATPSATFNGVVRPGSNPTLTGPPRIEQFAMYRVGGIAAVRARATLDGRLVRGVVALGVGLAYREMILQRKSATQNGQNLHDDYVPGSESYLSPAVVGEIGGRLRFARTTALAFGLLAWVENAGTTETEGDSSRHLSGKNGFVPIPTPPYELATSTQFFFGPYVGLEFGP